MNPRWWILGGLLLATMACAPEARGPSPTLPPDPTTTTPPTTTTTIGVVQGVGAFESCLFGNGVAIEAIPFDAQGRPRLDLVLIDVDLSDPDQAGALSSCARHLTSGPLDLSGSALISDAVMKTLSSFSECVRGKGVPDFPDPVADFRGVGGPYPTSDIPYDDPDLPTAVGICTERLGGGS